MSQPPVSRIYLVRHCDVLNPRGVLYGHLPNFPLSPLGIRQAHALGRFLASTQARRILASPLERAQQTARIIASHIPGSSITTTDDLIETRFGRHLQGVRPRDVPYRRPLWFVHLIRPGLLPCDESVPELAHRVRTAVRTLVRQNPVEGGICISHGDPIQAFWVEAEERPHRALHRLQCAKGGMLELDYINGSLVSKRYHSPESHAVPPSSPSKQPSHG